MNNYFTKKVKMIVGPIYETVINWPIIQIPVVYISKTMAGTGWGSNRSLKAGYLAVPVHFYSAIPDIEDLKKRKIWDRKNELLGLDFNEAGQLALLKELGQEYGQECRWPSEETGDVKQFFTHNPSFSFGCAASTHSMIRHYRPKHVIEIGSGMSSRVIANAMAMNTHDGNAGTYTIVDPFPRAEIVDGRVAHDRLVKERVELVNFTLFENLSKGDILFIDSSHSLKIGSDVYALYLEILPRIAPGVVIHIHDIQLPYEYPKAYATSETFRQFWTEQYLLQAFLAFNDSFRVLLGLQYLIRDHKKAFASAFPNYDAEDPTISGSFWMQKIR